MAEVFLSVLDSLLELSLKEVDLLISIEFQVEWIKRELKLMQSSLERVEANRQRVEDEMKWAGEAREIFQKVENMIDVYLRKSAQYRRRSIFWRSLFFLNHLGDRLKLSLKVQKTKVQMRNISNRRPKQPEGSYSYQERSSSQAGPSTSHKPQILHEAATAVAADRGTVDYVMSQNLLVPTGLTSEPAQTISSRPMGRRNSFKRFMSSFPMEIENDLLARQLAKFGQRLEEFFISFEEEWSAVHVRFVINALLEDVGDLERYDGRLKAWLKEIKDVLTDADAALTAFMETVKKNWLSIRKRNIQRVRVANSLEHLRHKIQDIPDRRMVYGIDLDKKRKATITMAGNPNQRQPPSVLIKRQDIVSLNDDLQALVALLLTNNEHRSIVSIVGMEGIGKTTLAELLYENIAVRQHFPCKAWVSVESDCNVEALMRLIKEQVLVSLHEQDEGLDAEEALVPMLSAILEFNRYLIVLDGVSTAEMWDRLIKEFPSTLHGSRIVLTTRDVDVATHADPKSVHKLRLLSDDDSWALFTKTPTVPSELLERSRKMVRRCGGLPGAIVQLREQFERTESTVDEWSRMLENPKFDQKPWKKTWDVMNSGLPVYLERCLFYLGRFPVDFDISWRRLIMLWIAEGLVDQWRADLVPPETVAGRCLAELIDRNMVQVTKRKLDGAVKNCRLPYALREICSSSEPKKTAYSKSHPDKNSKISPTGHKIPYLTHLPDGDGVNFDHIIGDTTNLSPNSLLHGYKHVISFRSFDTREGSQPGKDLGKFLELCISKWCFLSLRVLDLERVFRPELPEALGELILLRYLGLRWTYLEFLPSFINKLLNLQTLDVKHTSINTLPTSVWKMEQLRHLYLDESYRCRFVPRPRGYSLTDLQTLWSMFIDEDSPVKDGIDSFIKLKRLGVTSRLMSSRQEAMLSQLKAVAEWVEKLKLLQSLRLKSFDKQGKPWQLPKMDLTGHTNLSTLYLLGTIAENNFLASGLPLALTELTLSGSGLTEDPMPTLGELPNLRILRLFRESFVGKHMLCRSEGFPQLRILKLWKLEQLEEWEVENEALSVLIDLEIRSCQNLKKLPDELRYSRTLQKLDFPDMPGEWDNVRNARFTSNEDEFRSQIREKLVKSTISKSEKISLLKTVSGELLKGSEECPFCGAEPESAVHLFFLCKPIKMIWFAKWGIRTDFFPDLSIADWISIILTPSLIFGDSPLNETDFRQFAVILMEKTWLWRNKVVNDHVELGRDTIYEETCSSFLKEWKQRLKLNVAP